MKIIRDFFKGKIERKTAVTIGKFDSFHRGHKLLIDAISNRLNLYSTVLTFSENPNVKLKNVENKFLITNEERIKFLENQNVEYLILCDFNEKFMNTSPCDFIEILCKNYNMKYLIVGDDFKFGKGGKGNIYTLKKLSSQYKFELKVLDKMKENSKEISSSLIRDYLRKGDIENVNKLLGYSYFIYGKIEKGKGLGKKINSPTINITLPKDKILPLNGVYVTKISLNNKNYKAITNIGIRPTIADDNHISIETNILDFNEDIYEGNLKINFLSFVRNEIKFKNLEELSKQIQKDKAYAYEFFKK